LIAAPGGSSTTGWTACTATQGTGYNTASFTAAGESSNVTFACLVTSASPSCGSQWAANDLQVTVLNTGPTETASGGTNVCIGGSVTLTSSLSVSIPATYQWYSSTSAGFTPPVTISGATSTTYSPPTSTPGTLYYEVIATFSGSGCSPATSNAQTVIVYTAPTATISGGTSPTCYGSSPGIFTATSSGGSGAYTYLWYKNGSSTGITTTTYNAPGITATTSYYCSVTDAGGCGTTVTSTTTITVYPNLVVTISPGSLSICYNTSPGTFTATASGGPGTYTYQWYAGSGAVGGATASTYAPGNLTVSNPYYCSVTSGACTASTPISSITVESDLTAAASGGTSPICYNTSPGTFTATSTGGSGILSYQWYNGTTPIGGATANTYAPGSLTATTTYYCAVTRGICGPVNSNNITITVYPNLTASASSGTTTICYNTDPGAFTATGSGGTGSYTYQWYNGASPVSGAIASTYDPGSITTSTNYSCSVTSGSCGTVASNTISITVDPAVSVSIAGGTSPICYSTDPGTMTATASGGSGSYSYQWYDGSSSISGATASTYDPGNITSTSAYTCTITDAGCGSIGSNTTTITVDANLTASATGGTTPICYNTDPGTLTTTATGGTGGYTYQWYNGPGSISGATASTYNPGSITSAANYSCSVTSGSCGTEGTNTISILVDAAVTATVTGGTSPVCYNTNPGAFTATGSGGTGSYTYQWYNGAGPVSGATASTYDAGSLSVSGSYRCSVTSGSCGTVSSNTISITVDATLSATISGGTSPLCYNTAPGTFTATSNGGSGSYTYQWHNGSGSIIGATSSSYTPGNLTGSDSYYCAVTDVSGCGTVNSNIIVITVDVSFTASISGGTTPVCYSTSPGTFTAIGGGGGSSYSYQWYNSAGIITGATASTYAPGNLTAGNSYYCAVTDASGCGTVNTSATTILVDNNLTAGISGGTSPICYNTAAGTFTATGSGGTGTYTYQWYNSSGSISGATANTYSPGNITASTGYYCAITSGSCGTVNTSTTSITVDGAVTAVVTGGTTPVCYNTAPGTFTATAGGGTGTYTYQWYNSSGSISGATASTYAPGNITASTGYYCAITSGSCGTVNTSTTSITVDGAVTAVVTGGTTPVCYNTSPGTFTATASGGTGTYTYQWYNSSGSISGATASTYTAGNITSATGYSCSVTSGSCGTGSSNTVSISVDPVVTAVVTGGTTPVCFNTAPGTFTATAGGGGGSYTYQWYNSSGSISGATTSIYTPGNLTASNAYHVSVTDASCGSTVSNTVNITVGAAVTAVATGGTTPICYNTAPGTFTATGSGGISTYTYQWYNSSGSVSGATASTYAPGNLTASDVYNCTVTDAVCGVAATNTISITVDANLTASISGGITTICANTSPGTFTAAGSGGTGTYTYQWYNSSGIIGSATASTYNPGDLTSSTSYTCSVTSGSCGTVASNTISITVIASPASFTPTVTTNPVCITPTGGGTNVQVAGSQSGVNYQLQNIVGPTNVGSPVSGTGGTISLPTGTISANTSYQVVATTATSGCVYTTPSVIMVVAVDPDIAIGAQLSSNHFTFGTLVTPAMPSGWTTPTNTNSVNWGLATGNPATSGSYSYYNSIGGTSSASTGAYIQTPTGASATTPTVDLISGTINATGFTNISVQWGAQKSPGYTGTVSLYYSTDGGTSWSSAVSFTDAQANLTGSPWGLVNNSVQVKLPAAANNQANLKLKWSANPSTGTDYYSMNDIGVYALGKIVNCGTTSFTLPYLNTSCSASKYSLTADAGNPWPSSPAFSYVSGVSFSGSSIQIAVPATTANGTYNLDIKIDDGVGDYSGLISFPVTQDLLITATPALDNCSCNYATTSLLGSTFGNVVTIYAAGGGGTGYYFNSAGVVDTLLTTIDGSGNPTSGTVAQTGTAVKGVFWSKADGANHSYSVSDGYCTTTAVQVTQSATPNTVPFGNATGQPTAITAGHGGGNGISGSFNNAATGDANITKVNGPALTCHQTADFGNNWVVYQVNNMNSLGVPLAGDSTNNKAVVEINNNGFNLDSVQVSIYRDAYLPTVPNDYSAVACSGYPDYAMERHFMIKSDKSTGANSFENAVGVRLYFTDAEFQDLAYWTNYVASTATGQTANCAYDDTVSNINSIYVTKYTGINEDGNYGNNAPAPSGLYRVFGKNATAPGNGPLTAIDGGAATLTTGGTTNLHYVQMNVNEFSEFWLGGSQGGGEALPVQMIYLEAEAMSNDSIQVRWGTASEINNREFDVERSTDGNTWTMVNVTPGHDNSSIDQFYTFNDLNVTQGIVYYYRLKQVDNNGNYQYTGIVQAELTGAGAFTVMNFVPNPTSGNTQLTVVTTKEQEITVDFYDMLGQKVLTSIQQLNVGTNRIDFNLQRFASGTYSAVVTSDDQLYTKKIVITR
jgi:hypothetical protein